MKNQATAKRPSCAIVNKRQLSEILGVSEETLTSWQADGMPVKTKGAQGVSGEYEPAAAIRWWLDRELDKVRSEQPRDRLARVQADRIEMDMTRERGELIPAEEIDPAWSGQVIATRQEMLSLPPYWAPRIRRSENDDAAIDLMAGAIEDALRKMSEDEDEPSAAEVVAQGPEALGTAA